MAYRVTARQSARRPGWRVGFEHLAALALLAAASLALTLCVVGGESRTLDVRLTVDAQRLGGLSDAAWFFNRFLHDWGIPVAWWGTVAVFVVLRRWQAAAFFALAFLIQPATRAVKLLVDRPRPSGPFDILEFPADPSFPSGHTTTAMGFFGAWFLLAPYVLPPGLVWPVRVVSAAAILLTAFFRVWVGAHWPTDVLAGILMGAAFLLTLWAALPPLFRATPGLRRLAAGPR